MIIDSGTTTLIVILIGSTVIFLVLSLISSSETVSGSTLWLPHGLLLTGFSLFLTQGTFPVVFSVFFPNTLIVLSIPAFIFETSRLLDRRPIWAPYMVITGLFLVALFYFTYVENSIRIRGIFVFGTVGFFAVLATFSFRRLQSEERSLKPAMFVVLFAIMAVVNWGRAIQGGISIPNPNRVSILQRDFANTVSLYMTVLFVLTWNLSYYAMAKFKVEIKLRKKVRILRALYEDIDRLHGFLQSEEDGELSSVYPIFFSILKDIANLEHIAIFLLNDTKDTLILQAQRGLDQESTDLLRTLSMNYENISARSFQEQRIISIDIQQYPDNPLKARFLKIGFTAIVSCPVFSRGEPLGTISLGLFHGTSLQTATLEVLQVLSKQLGTVLHNHRLYRRIFDSEKRYEAVFRMAGDALFVMSFDERFLEINDTAVERLGYSREELFSLGPKAIETTESFQQYQFIATRLHGGKTVSFESEHRTKSGTILPVWIKCSLISFDDKPAILSLARYIDDKSVLKVNLNSVASVNRLVEKGVDHSVEERIHREIYRAKRFDRELSFAMIGFLDITPEEHLFKFCAEQLKPIMRETDFFVPVSDDNMLLVMPETNLASALTTGKRAADAFASAAYVNEQGMSVNLSSSIGVSARQGSDISPADILERARKAMRTAQATGGSRVVPFE